MTTLLRGLDLLVTSRYHAAVLSLAAGVPQVAVGHDTRLATLYQDLGLSERWFIDPGVREWLARGSPAPELFTGLQKRVDLLLEAPGLQKEFLGRGYAEHLARARQNRQLLSYFVDWNLPSTGVARGGFLAEKGGAGWVA
jgi:hypothetical protein